MVRNQNSTSENLRKITILLPSSPHPPREGRIWDKFQCNEDKFSYEVPREGEDRNQGGSEWWSMTRKLFGKS
jgi:hypothetical protein